MAKQSALSKLWYEYRIELITVVFVAEVLASPLADTDRQIGAVLALVGLVTLFLAVSYIGNTKIVTYAVVPAAGVWAVARAFEAFGDHHRLYAQLAPASGLLLSCAMLVAIFDHFSSVPEVPRSAISEAFICYLVIAIAFSQVYWILNRVLDHPFNQQLGADESGSFLYFSMMTLSSVGYGGILPINPYLRLVASLETMVGIFFVAVVVARLVSSYRPQPREKHRPTQD